MTSNFNPITEDDIANFLVNTPDFFDRHAELLASVRLSSPHGARAVSLQERQAEMLREKIRALELRLMEMMRHGTENDVLAERMQRWVKSLLLTTNARDLPTNIAAQIEHEFMVPQVAIRVWGVAEAFRTEPFTQGVDDAVRAFADGLHTPYVGIKPDTLAMNWLTDAASVQSVALIALRASTDTADAPAPASGLALLERLGDLASAALSHLR